MFKLNNLIKLFIINKIFLVTILLCIVILSVLIPSVNSHTLMNGTQSSKSIFFLLGIGLITAFTILRFWLSPKFVKLKFSKIDLLFFLFISYILFRNKWVDLENSLLFLELCGLTLWYSIIRFQSEQILLLTLMGLCIGGLIQAFYGNLQLWGYYPSHHSMFKMTGSFFNPGPYAGYLAAVFPISLGFYLFNISIGIPVQLPIFTKLNSWSVTIKTFIKRLFVVTHFFYNKCKGESTSEKLVEKPDYTYVTLKSLMLISIIGVSLVLPASRSRAAWLAVLISSGYLFLVRYRLGSKIRSYINTCLKQLGLISVLVTLISITASGLYFFKKGSADGRLLIWKISTEMINDNPILGMGYDGFTRYYMDYQSVYFENNPDSEELLVAGDTNYAFNEPLQLTVEHGFLGIILIGAIVLFVFFGKYTFQKSLNEKEDFRNDSFSLVFLPDQKTTEETRADLILLHIARATILSIFVFSLFSYPLQILPIKICLTVALAIVANILSRNVNLSLQTPFRFNKSLRFINRSIISVGLLGMIFSIMYHLHNIKIAYTDWKNAFELYNYGIYNDCLNEYEKAYPILKTNGSFLTNYGKALSMAEKHEKAIGVLQQAAGYYPNTVVYTTLGDCYKKMSQTHNAEQAYLHAWYMNPNRFYPKYLLVKLYDESGQKEKSIEVAKELLGKDIKVESTAIEEIKVEMRKIIEKTDSKTLNEGK